MDARVRNYSAHEAHFAYTSVKIALQKRRSWENKTTGVGDRAQMTGRGISGNYAKGDNAKVEQRPIALSLSLFLSVRIEKLFILLFPHTASPR